MGKRVNKHFWGQNKVAVITKWLHQRGCLRAVFHYNFFLVEFLITFV